MSIMSLLLLFVLCAVGGMVIAVASAALGLPLWLTLIIGAVSGLGLVYGWTSQ